MDSARPRVYFYYPVKAQLMQRLICFLCLLLSLTTACNPSSSFDKEVWVDNPEMDDTSNPRARMVQDLMQNHLKHGMSREAVLNLLGKPYKDGIEQRLPKGVVIPDSLSFTNSNHFKRENQQKAVDGINTFYRSHSQPDTLMLYPVGWSIIDPNFLVSTLR